MLIELAKTLTPYLILINIFFFFGGLIIGNWQAIGRDRRKELLGLTTPLRKLLIDQLHNSDGFIRDPVSSKDLSYIGSMYTDRTIWDRIRGRGYQSAVDDYKRLHKECAANWRTDKGEFYTLLTSESHVPPEMLSNYHRAIKRLLKYMPFK